MHYITVKFICQENMKNLFASFIEKPKVMQVYSPKVKVFGISKHFSGKFAVQNNSIRLSVPILARSIEETNLRFMVVSSIKPSSARCAYEALYLTPEVIPLFCRMRPLLATLA